MMGSSKSNQGAAQTVYSGLRLQSSVFGKAIPLVYGTSRVSCNILWWGNFIATAVDTGGGK